MCSNCLSEKRTLRFKVHNMMPIYSKKNEVDLNILTLLNFRLDMSHLDMMSLVSIVG